MQYHIMLELFYESQYYDAGWDFLYKTMKDGERDPGKEKEKARQNILQRV